jgi:DNA polymerase-3 subunit epsilon
MWVAELLRRRPQLPVGLDGAVQAWRALPEPDLDAGPEAARWVVVDTETSGLDPHRDRLLALGAVRIEGGRVALEQSFDAALLQQTTSAHANILIHGIGEGAQRSGAQPEQVLADFLGFAGKDVLVGFHAPFDATVLRRAMRAHLGLRFRATWLDVEAVARCVFPEAPARA